MQQSIILFGGQRWGKDYVVRLIEDASLQVLWPNQLPEDLSSYQLHVVAMDEYVAHEAVLLAKKLELPFYSMQSHEATYFKDRLRAIWNRIAIEDEHLLAVNFEMLPPGRAPIQQCAVPLIVKPNAYSGSVGVELVTELADLDMAIANCRAALQEEQERYKGELDVQQGVLIEQAIPRKNIPKASAEFTLHMLSTKGQHQLITTAKKQLASGSFIEIGHRVPATNLPDDLRNVMLEVTQKMLQQLDVQHCISNWEYMVTPDNKVALIEGQLRPSGDRLMQLIHLATGINPFKALVDGKIEKLYNGSASITWLGPDAVDITDSAIKVPGLPDNAELIIDEAALRADIKWPGPTNWYNRHVAVITHTTDQLATSNL